MSALEDAGRLPASAYKGATMYTTLSPCDMCTGACILYKVSRVVMGENKTFVGGEKYLEQRGVEVINVSSHGCSASSKAVADLLRPIVGKCRVRGPDEEVHQRPSGGLVGDYARMRGLLVNSPRTDAFE